MKFNTSVYFVFLLTVFSWNARAQTSTSNPEPDDDIVKINTSLVQIDAVVTDKNGSPVTNLKKSDFEIWQDGKRKKLTNFSFLKTASESQPKVDKQGREKVLVPSVRRRKNSTGRVITFVVDDGNCTSSKTGMDLARKGLQDFVSRQMYPTDLVAVYRTRSGSGLLQQYTSDKAQLMKVVKKIRWLPALGCSNTGDFFSSARQNDSADKNGDKVNEDDLDNDGLTPDEINRRKRQAVEDNNRDNQIVGTLGVIRYIIKGLKRIRGRKIVFLMSDGMPTLDERGNSRQARNVLGAVTEEANRSAVVLNTVDVRGNFAPGMITAGDDIKITKDFDGSKSSTADVSNARRAQFRSSQDSLAFLADETGGKFYRGNNNIGAHLEKAMKIEKGYYLLGYEPDQETFKGTKYHKIEVRLKRPELRVFSRAGFFGREDRKRKPKNGKGSLYEAIVAPLPEAGLDIRLTAFYGNSIAVGQFVRSLVHIAGKDIVFVDDKVGMKRAVFDVVAVTLDKKNNVIDEFARMHTIRVKDEAVPFIHQNGLVYTTDVKVKKPGTYNFRLAIRDTNSDFVGSATQIVEIPKFKKGRIYVSGLVIGAVDQNGRFEAPSSKSAERAISLIGSKSVAEIRSFEAGTRLGYSYTIYNAKTEPSNGEPRVDITMNLYKDGILVSKGIPKRARFGLQSDWSRIRVKGYLKIGPEFEKADYALQIVVKDLLQNRNSTQWIDFEVN